MGYSPWGHKELDTTEQLGIAQHRIRNNQRNRFRKCRPPPPEKKKKNMQTQSSTKDAGCGFNPHSVWDTVTSLNKAPLSFLSLWFSI